MDYLSFTFPLLLRAVSVVEAVTLLLAGVLAAGYGFALWHASRPSKPSRWLTH